MRKNVGAKHDLFSLTARADLAASTIHNLSELTRQELTRGFPRHNTAQYWRAWEGGGDVLFVSTQRGEGDNLTK